MSDIEFKDKENLSVDVICTFEFASLGEKQKIIKELQESRWNCLNKLGDYLEAH